MIKNGKPIRLNRYRGWRKMPDWKWNEKGVAKKRGRRGMIDFRQRNNRFDLSMDDLLRLYREILSSCFHLFHRSNEVRTKLDDNINSFERIRYNNYVAELSRTCKVFIFVDTDEIAESTLHGFLGQARIDNMQTDRKPVRHYRFAECKLQTCPRTWWRSNFPTMYWWTVCQENSTSND